MHLMPFWLQKYLSINELANLCEKTGVDIKDISQGMGLQIFRINKSR